MYLLIKETLIILQKIWISFVLIEAAKLLFVDDTEKLKKKKKKKKTEENVTNFELRNSS